MLIPSAPLFDAPPPLTELLPSGVVAFAPSTQKVFFDALCVARSPHPALILGESGAGKEVVARFVHDQSPRAAAPYVTVNCAAFADTLAESELFGHLRGAFTGAMRDRPGLLQKAHGGTLFLDELGELSHAVQAKLLRVLECGEVLPVGADQPVKVNVRIVGATHRDLAAHVRAGTFRHDLYFRLAVFRLRVPALRERRADIVPLALSILRRADCAKRLGADAVARLESYSWPGNVRELRNVLHRASVFSSPQLITAADIRFDEAGFAEALAPWRVEAAHHDHQGAASHDIVEALWRQGGRRKETYETLGVSKSTFYRRLRQIKADPGAEVPGPR